MSPIDRDDFAARTLRDLLRSRGRLSFERTAQILADAAAALAPLHAVGQAHGAITPQSLHVDADGRVYVGPPAADTSAIGLLPPAYLAPERIGGQPADPRSDVYALGLLGWEMLTGQTPWAGASLQELVLDQPGRELPRLSAVRPGVPQQLLLAIERALQKAPSDRWSNAGELLAALRPAAAAAFGEAAVAPATPPAMEPPIESPRPTSRPIALGPITAHREPVIPAVPIASGLARKSTRGRKLAMVALALAVLVAGGAAVASLQGRAKQTVTASWLDSLTTSSDAGIVVVDDTSRDTAARLRARAIRDSLARTGAAPYPSVPAWTNPAAQAEQQLQAQQQLQAAEEAAQLRAEAARQRAIADSIAAAARVPAERTEAVPPPTPTPTPVPVVPPEPTPSARTRDSARDTTRRDSTRVRAPTDSARQPTTKPDSVKPLPSASPDR